MNQKQLSEPMRYGLRMLRRPPYTGLDKDSAISLHYLIRDLCVPQRTLVALKKRGLIETLVPEGPANFADLFTRIRLTPGGQHLADEAIEEHRKRRAQDAQAQLQARKEEP